MSEQLAEEVARDVRRVAAEAELDARTVARAFCGERPRSKATLRAIEEACTKLGVKAPVFDGKKKRGKR